MYKITLFLLLMSLSVSSQKIHFIGKIVDKETQKPVVYANVSFLKINKGISTTENGTFNLKIAEKLLNQQIHISCLNYKDTVVFAYQLHKSILFLQPKVVELDEIKISRKVDRELVVDKIRRRVSPMHSPKIIPMIAKYFPFKKTYLETLFLKEIEIRFSNSDFQKSKFRIRIFSKDIVSGLPKEDLLKKSFTIVLLKKQKSLKIDLSSLDIEFPKDGLFIAFEKLFIPFNEYLFKPYKGKKQIYYAPTIGMTYSKESIGIERNYFYALGKWAKWPMPVIRKNKRFVPAISLILSN